ncbi:hypothetical protein [Roseospirillum parvum]|uniref:Peroxiredoxin family protein n=1 Tax=Roseospirillum parvum TaxID=83401 RepID=A0A1G8FWR7_9PROT|nr:hypothetical protein [Roseospirillum parvum]SDH86602.1 Peroxiredoxin family protein [Roseospirillum parvum]
MSDKPLYILLVSGEREKLQMAAMTASVAAVSDRPTEVFVSMNAILSFKRGLPPEERYPEGGGFFAAQFAKASAKGGTPDAVDLLAQGRMLGGVKVWACAMVLDMLGWEDDDLTEDLFDGRLGLTKFLADAESGDLVSF